MHKPTHPDDFDKACHVLLPLYARGELPVDLTARRALLRFWVESARLEREATNAGKPPAA